MYEDIKIENIGLRQSRSRLLFGIFVLIITLGVLGIMMSADISRWWRLFLVIPFSMAALGYMQARSKTCVVLATQGMCNFDHGDEPITDEEVRKLLIKRSQTIRLQSILLGIILTVLSLSLPV